MAGISGSSGEPRPLAGSLLGSFWRLLAVGRLHITAIAAMGTFTFGWLFTGRYPWVLTGACAVDWYLVNLVNRAVDLEEDRANAIPGTGFVLRNRGKAIGFAVFLLVASLLFTHLRYPAVTPLRVAFHLLGALYNWPLLPGGRRLKQLYFWKNAASAFGFVITLFAYPLAGAGRYPGAQGFPAGISWGTVIFSVLFFFLFELSYEVIYDLRDVKGDAMAGIRTYPVVHGQRTAVRIVNGLILSSMGVLAAGYGLGKVPWRIFIMILVPPLQFFLCRYALRRGITTGDCIAMTWLGVGLMLVYHAWVLAGLPGVGL